MTVIDQIMQMVTAVENFMQTCYESFFGKILLVILTLVVLVLLVRYAKTHVNPHRFRFLLRVLVTAGAAGVAWQLVSSMGSNSAAFAASAAVVSVQLGLAWSLKDAGRVIGATTVGVVVAYITVHLAGAGVLAVVAAVTAALLAGRFMGMGLDGAAAVASTSVFAASLGNSLTDFIVVDRVIATLVGAIVGVVAGAIPATGSPLKIAEKRVQSISVQLSKLYSDLADVVTKSVPKQDAEVLLKRSRDLQKQVQESEQTIEAAIGHARWSPLTSAQNAAGSLVYKWTLVRHGVQQANNTARALFDVSDTDAATRLSTTPASVSGVLQQAAAVYKSTYDTSAMVALGHDAALASDVAASELHDEDDTKTLMLGGEIVSSVSRTVGVNKNNKSISTDTPPLDDVLRSILPPHKSKVHQNKSKPDTQD